MHRPRHLLLDSHGLDGSTRLLSEKVSLAEGQAESWETLTRVVRFDDDYYGEVNITRAKLDSMVRNFDSRVFDQDLAVDIAHMPSNGAAGFIRKLSIERNKLRALIEWTEFGKDAVIKKGFRYFSAEFHEQYKHPETGEKHGCTLMGAGLTTRPRVKGLDAVDPKRLKLSFDDIDGDPPAISPRIMKLLHEDMKMLKAKMLKLLSEALSGFKSLSDDLVKQFTAQFDEALSGIEDEAQAKVILSAFTTMAESTHKFLSENDRDPDTIKLDFSGAKNFGSPGLTKDDVLKFLDEQKQADEDNRKKLSQQKDANVKIFTDAINGQEGFSDELKKQLSENVTDLITADMTEGQIKALADNQIAMGSQLTAQRELASMGWQGGSGSVRVEHVTTDDSKKLQEQICEGLRRTSHSANGRLRLAEKETGFVSMVLAQFDRMHAPQIHREVKMLAGGETATSDTNLPVGFQRTVIREALSDLRVLELVQTLTDFNATGTTQIPYETRDTSDVQNDGIVYEGQPIHRASVSQAMDLAYILPMKLAFLISNEVMHFTRASAINWDAYARNVESNARVMRELIVRRICNELQRSADAFNAATVTAETFDTQLTGSNSIIKTAEFPIVRPHQQRDLQGNAVGSVENPITITLNGSAITAYDGTGTQTAGTYFRVTNYNLGYIQLVDETGTPVTPSDTGVNTVTYSKATNIIKVDSDLGSATLEQRMNDILRGVGSMKAMMSAERFVMPDFQLMSPVLNDMATNAEQFAASAKRSGTDTTASGDLETIKSIPAYSTNAPGVDLGDERILLGQRGTLSYTLAKPFVTGSPFEAVDSNGKAIGKKQAYGEEYSAIKVPTPIRGRLSSVIVYSASGR